jgi:hypothetical protein
MRHCEGKDKDLQVLILANLDCENSCRVFWDGFKFDATRAVNLVSGGEVYLDSSSGYELKPGEVVCVGQEKTE